MANKREFKKDVDCVFETVIEECVFTADFFPEKQELVEKLIDEAIALYNDTRFAYKMDDKMSNKAFYNGLITNYVAKMSDILTKLNESQK
ncbi:MAG: hypothetical protein MJ198_05630 [Bacteroidales bacterium]|nr:hypothetical protein [Bacteroidales bacterium]